MDFENPTQQPGSGDAPLVGRDALMRLIADALQHAEAGSRKVVLLTGEAGIGKSRCIREVEALAIGRGLPVRLGRCVEGEGAPPYWPWIQILRQHCGGSTGATLQAKLGGEADLLSRLLEESPSSSAEGSDLAPARRFQLFDAVSRFLTSSAERGLVLLLDDLHRADTPSILLMRHLIRESSRARLLLVGSYRDTDVDEDHPLLRALGTVHSEHQVFPLAGLGVDDVSRVVGLLTNGDAPSPKLVRLLHERTAGNPLFVTESIRLLEAEQTISGVPDVARALRAVPTTVRQVIRQRLAALSADTLDALSVAALVGREFTIEIVDRARAKRGRLLDCLDQAMRARLVEADRTNPGTFRFTHDLVRETLHDDVLLERRAHIHARIGAAIEAVHAGDLAPHLARLAHHLLEAATLGGSEHAVEIAERAALEARCQLAHEETARHYEAALRGLELIDCPGSERAERRSRLLVDLGDARWAAGDQAGARRAFRDAIDVARRIGAAEVLARAAFGYTGRTDLSLGIDRTSVDLLEEALDALGGVEHSLACRVTARLATALYFSPERDRGVCLAREAVEMAERIGELETLAYTLTALCYMLRRPGHEPLFALADRIVATAQQGGSRDLEALGQYERMLEHLEQGDVAGADLAISECERIANELGEPWFQWWATGFVAMRALLGGDLDRCQKLVGRGFELGSSVDTPNTLPFFGGTLFYLHRDRGGIAELEDAIRLMAEQTPGQPVFRLALAHIVDEAGRVEEARALYSPIARGVGGLPLDAMWSASIFLAVDLAISLRDLETARGLAEILDQHAGRCHLVGFGNAWLGSGELPLGRLAHMVGRHDDAVAHLNAALTVHRQANARPLVARTLAALARALRDRGLGADLDRAARAAEEARAIADEIGMMPLRLELDSVPNSSRRRPVRGRLARTGEGWEATYMGRTTRFGDAKGVRDIIVLLSVPRRAVHVNELIREGEGVPQNRGGTIDPEAVASGQLSLRRAEVATETLDERARAAYRARLRDARVELDEAAESNDRGRSDVLLAEIDAIESELSAGFAAVRSRPAASPSTERARKAVTKRIVAAIERLERHHPEFARHLRSGIRTGTFCIYEPEQPTEWNIVDPSSQAR